MSKNTKKIASYINNAKDKAEDIFYKIRFYAEDIIAQPIRWFENHAKELKAKGIKTASMLLACATIATAGAGMTGCTINPENPNESTSISQSTDSGEITYPVEITTRSPEEIAETGVKAEDILAAFDLFAQNLVAKTWQLYLDNGDITQAQFDEVVKNAKFENISSECVPSDKENGDPEPLVVFLPRERVVVPWYIDNSEPIYRVPSVSISFNYTDSYKGDVIKETNTLPLPLESTATILRTFGAEDIIIDCDNYRNRADLSQFHLRTLLPYDGEPALTTITIDRNSIKSASQDQLNSIYNLILSITNYIQSGDMSCFEDTINEPSA